MDVLTLRGVLTLDKSQYDNSLATAEKGARSFGGRFSKAMKIGVASAAAVGVAVGVMSKKLVSAAKDTAAYGDKVDKMSQKIGISAESYQKWDYVMQRAGGNVDQLKMGMKTLSQQAEKNSDAFQKLGISQEEVQNLSKEELFEKTVKGLSDMKDSTERTALASKLLGRAGADMGPLLNQGSEAIDEQMKIAEKYGMVMPDSAVKASAAFEDSMTTLQMTSQGLKNRLMGEFLPAMTQVADGLALMFTGDMSGLDDVMAGVKDFIGKLGGLVPKIMEAGGKLILGLLKGLVQKLPDLIAAGAQMFGKLLEGLQKSLGNASPPIAQIVEAIAQFIVDNAPKLIQTAVVLVGALARGLLEALPELIAAVPKLIKTIAQTLAGYNWAGVGKKVLKGIAGGIRAAGGLLRSAGKAVVDKFKSVISSGFSAANEKAVAYMGKLKDGVKKKIDAAKNAVKKVVDKIKGFFPINVGKIFKGWLPKIKLFSKKGKDSAETNSSVSHVPFAKAMSQPYMFKRPTEFYAGEAGDEMLYGKTSLMRDISDAVEGAGTGSQQVIVTNYITVEGAENPEDFAERFARKLKLDMRMA